MKLTYLQLEAHLTKQLAPIYIISGEELILKLDALHLIRKAAKRFGFNERIRITAEKDLDEENLYSSFYSSSLFSEKRLLELDFRDSTPNKAIAKILQEYAENPAADIVLVINIGKVDDKISKTAWYKTLEKNGVTLPLWSIPREQLPQWIQQRARRYKLQIHQDAVNVLVDYVEGNLIAAAQALEKIYLLRTGTIVDSDLIKKILTDESHFTVFDFTDSLIAGNQTRAIHILEILKDEGIEPVLILWSITRELRVLAEIAHEASQGMTYSQLFQKQRIFARRQTAMLSFLKKFNAENCWQYLADAAEIDKVIKGAVVGNVWDSLQLFCLRLTPT